MFYYQKGFLPQLTSIIGSLIPITFFGRITTFILPQYLRAINGQPALVIFNNSIKYLIPLMLSLVIPFFIGFFLTGLFPAIYVSKNSLVYKYFGGVVTKKVLWEELEAIRKPANGHCILIINRPGLPIFNGLYMNTLYGRLLKYSFPVILISLNTDEAKKLVQEIEVKVI